MPRALEVLQTARQLERGEASALEVIDTLFEGTISSVAVMAALLAAARQTSADGLIEFEGTSGDHITGANNQDWSIAAEISDSRHFAMARCNPTLLAPLQHGMRGNQGTVLEDLYLVGQRMHLDGPLPGRIRDAVKVAADAHYALMRDTPFQLKHRGTPQAAEPSSATSLQRTPHYGLVEDRGNIDIIGDDKLWLRDLHAAWKMENERTRLELTRADADVTWDFDIAAPRRPCGNISRGPAAEMLAR
jgi:hypothetical protein